MRYSYSDLNEAYYQIFNEEADAAIVDSIKQDLMSKRQYNNSGYMAKRAIGDIFSRIGSIFGSIPIIGTFGGIIDILKSNNPNRNLSSQLTSMFANTNINAYTYRSGSVFSVSYLGTPISTKPIPKGLVYIPLIGASITTVWQLCEFLMNMIGTDSLDLNNMKLDGNGKIIIPPLDVTVYISERLIEVLDTDDEIKAICLHWIGANSQLIKACLADIAMGLGIGTAVLGNIVYEIDSQTKNYTNRELVLLLLAAALTLMVISKLSARNITYTADSFAVKCGYGEALKSAITKIQYFKGKYDDQSIIQKIYDKLGYLVRSLWRVFQKTGLSTTPDISQRLANIEQTTSSNMNSPLITSPSNLM